MKRFHCFVFLTFIFCLRYQQLMAVEEDLYFERNPISVEQYAVFLNAVSPEEALKLYDSKMEVSQEQQVLLRIGNPGFYFYQVAPGKEKEPLLFLNKEQAICYQEWLQRRLQQEIAIESGDPNSDRALASNQNFFVIFHPSSLASLLMQDNQGGDHYLSTLLKIGGGIFLSAYGFHYLKEPDLPVLGTLEESISELSEVKSRDEKNLQERSISKEQRSEDADFIHVELPNALNNSLLSAHGKNQWEHISFKDIQEDSLAEKNKEDEDDFTHVESPKSSPKGYVHFSSGYGKYISGIMLNYETGEYILQQNDIAKTVGVQITQVILSKLTDSHQTIVAHFYETLKNEYGELIAQKSFPQEIQEKVCLYGLDNKVVFDTLKAAIGHKAQELVQKVEEMPLNSRSLEEAHQELKENTKKYVELLTAQPEAPKTALDDALCDTRSSFQKMIELPLSAIDLAMLAKSTVVWTQRGLFILSLL